MGTPLRGTIFGDTRFVASAINMTGARRGIRSPTPEPGAHTDEVLAWLGYSKNEIAELRAAGVAAPVAQTA
jgi:crotonobetainyl-CoA:carnitine CoA-transferase CaiB-like acyl-CoA transferase